jgi:hypothetical protein
VKGTAQRAENGRWPTLALGGQPRGALGCKLEDYSGTGLSGRCAVQGFCRYVRLGINCEPAREHGATAEAQFHGLGGGLFGDHYMGGSLLRYACKP